MKINRLQVENYRSLEGISLTFPTFYSAICGRNDSGKTNIVRVLRTVIKEENFFYFPDDQDVSIKNDYTKWKEGEQKAKRINVLMEFSIDQNRDAGLYEFLVTFLALEEKPGTLLLSIEAVYAQEDSENKVSITVNDKGFDGLKAQEVLKKLQSSVVFLFHNSTDPDQFSSFRRRLGGFLGEYSAEYSSQLDSLKKTVNQRLTRILTQQQKEITELLGRLEDKYKVGLSVSNFELEYLPFSITLGDKNIDVPLDDWGSGTRNRTLILMTLFKAKQISDSSTSASKITPIIIIEEPESFLHPSAQAEFGRILQDLSEEFKVQVIATTHSPYMLSQEKPNSNILLERQVVKNQLRETTQVDTSGEDWMEPFGLALGVDNREFEPWKDLFFSNSDSILLVEGEIDKEYFDLLREPVHGEKRLDFSGEIFAYGGRDTLKNAVLLKFIKNRYKKIFVTFDLDAEAEVEKTLASLGFQKNRDYCPIGIDAVGKRDIEGLLPDSIVTAVYADNPDLVRQAMNGTTLERRSAKQRLKGLLLEEFKAKATPSAEYYGKFYGVVRIMNKALN